MDHGKSTLIGRLCLDTGALQDGKLEEIKAAAEASGRELELGYVMDHLEEERTRAMTIDTAQTFFHSPTRDYVVIDAPGHKELTRNMITGASQADAAILVLDAAEGVQEQTRRHAYFLSLLGIQQVTVLVNKMDLVGCEQARFDALSGEMRSLLKAGGTEAMFFVPGSARHGDNIVRPSSQMPWYRGPTLLSGLDEFCPPRPDVEKPLRFPIQDVYQVDGRRILVGRVEAGVVEAGCRVTLLPSGGPTRVLSVEVFGENRAAASAGEAIGLTLESSSAIARGQVACTPDGLPAVTARLRASVFWMARRPLACGEELQLRLATQELPARIEAIEERIDSSTLECLERQAPCLYETEVGRVVLRLGRPAVVEPFHSTPGLGRFVLERGSDVTGGGVVTHEADIRLGP